MTTTILIPHYKTGMMTAYTLSQILKYKGDHIVKIVLIDNNAGDGSIEYLEPFRERFTYVPYPKEKLQSHGVAYGYALDNGYVETDHFITLESDSYPTSEGFLDYYQQIIDGGFDMAGSLLTLSGGSFVHPAGAIYSKALYNEAKKICDDMPYRYFPNMSMRDNFKMHLMVHDVLLERFLENPDEWVDLSPDYKPYSKEMAIEKLKHYSSVCGVFHDGRGGRGESIKTFGGRTWESEAPYSLYNTRWSKLVGRVGQEPGQNLYYLAVALKKKIFNIPTKVKWLEGKEFRQQEYTLNEPGIKHAWGVSAYHGYTPAGDEYVAKIKQELPEQLYNTLPPNQRIK